MPFSLKAPTQIGSGRVQYTGLGKFDDPQITPTLTAGTLSLAVSSTYPGDYYTAAPTITVTDRGTGTTVVPAVTASATAAVSGAGAITSVTLTEGGHFYTSVPAVTVGAVSGASGGSVVAAINASGAVTAVSIAAAGTAYTAVPTLSIAAPPASVNGTATAVLSGGYVISIAVGGTNTGYTTAPVISFSGGGGSGATATAQMDLTLGKVLSIQVTNPGSNYTAAPTVALSNVGATNVATGTAVIAAKVGSLTGVAGFGYTSTPNVSIGSPQAMVMNVGGAAYQIYSVESVTPIGEIGTPNPILWTFPNITQDTAYSQTQFRKNMLLPNPNSIIVLTRNASSLTRGQGFAATWIGS